MNLRSLSPLLVGCTLLLPARSSNAGDSPAGRLYAQGARAAIQHDLCPDDPEDMDGFQDDDGCPDPDNDQDGILDIDDRCPNDPEDRDGFEDDDGCPDPDNDQDGILDASDRCPLEPETFNGVSDEDGCPDRGRPEVTDRHIEVHDQIFFVTNQAIIKGESHAVLDGVAQVLKESPRVALIEIQGHADERATAAYNVKLTQERAEAVRSYLIEHGVAPERLKARGYGNSRPRCRQHTEACWSENRRVEFLILRRASE